MVGNGWEVSEDLREKFNEDMLVITACIEILAVHSPARLNSFARTCMDLAKSAEMSGLFPRSLCGHDSERILRSMVTTDAARAKAASGMYTWSGGDGDVRSRFRELYAMMALRTQREMLGKMCRDSARERARERSETKVLPIPDRRAIMRAWTR